MNTLLLDTTYKELIVSIAIDDKIVDTTRYECWQRQSEYTILEIDKLLRKHGFDSKKIGEIVVTNGPGSYTGVRIALTIAKIYCYALQIPCYVLSSLQVLQDKGIPSICLINARSNRSYVGVYKDNKVILKDQVMKNDEILEYIKKHNKYIVCGDIEYLELPSRGISNIPENMLRLKHKSNMIKNVLDLKAVYLKD